MRLFPAIDLYEGKAVRLLKGDYDKMTVYSDKPCQVALTFKRLGMDSVHIVDLEGARDGSTPNRETALAIKRASGLFCEIGGGIRDMDVIESYLSQGMDRVILGTAALMDRALLKQALSVYGDKIAVGVDVKDGKVAIRGWRETADMGLMQFAGELTALGVKTIICTDISRDGAMRGANRELYRQLTSAFPIDIVASGGVSDLEDIRALKRAGAAGAIIGKAYYTGALKLDEAKEAAQ
ncbi:MAG: 1-(5-phosphoribosyl)-5-[Clostridia bacterium]|nr:1-(5-phosphoribosyl)-5-[(5-phosphoribosylamino)methylideneamino]imidazole-4-carboxamide isomerase [Clostridia bacterium]